MAIYFCSWLFLFMLIKHRSISQEIIAKSNVICDGGINNDSCIESTILCPEGIDCEINCNNNRRRRLQTHRSLSSVCKNNIGCCNTNVYCPKNAKCLIHCTKQCDSMNIYAQNSTYLTINDCNEINTQSTCSYLNVYCPNNKYNKCEFNGYNTIYISKIYSIRGFNDIIINNPLHADSTIVYCVYNATQHICQSNPSGTSCLPPKTECNKIITETPTFEPSIEPTVEPSEESSMFPTMFISLDVPNTSIPRIFNTLSADNTNNYIQTEFGKNNNSSAWSFIGYLVVISLLFIPTILVIIGILFHKHYKGSDPPNYLQIFKCFANIADLYTDIVFCIALYFKNSFLYLPAAVFVICPHVLSNIIALYYIHKWRKLKIEYIQQYDNLLIALTVLAGFYPSIDFLSSKLFYLKQLSMQLSNAERYKIQQLRFINDIIFENIPLMIIQILSVISTNIDSITIMAFVFSAISLMIGLLTLISRLCSKEDIYTKYGAKKLSYNLNIKSSKLRLNHKYSYRLLAQSLSYCFEISIARIETISIMTILNGLSCDIEITLSVNNKIDIQNDELKIDEMINEISLNNSSLFKSFQTALCQNLCIDNDLDLEIITTKLTSSGASRSILSPGSNSVRNMNECAPLKIKKFAVNSVSDDEEPRNEGQTPRDMKTGGSHQSLV